MKNLLLFYSLAMAALSTGLIIALAIVDIDFTAFNSTMSFFLIAIGYTTSAITYNWWRDSKKTN